MSGTKLTSVAGQNWVGQDLEQPDGGGVPHADPIQPNHSLMLSIFSMRADLSWERSGVEGKVIPPAASASVLIT